MPTIMQLTGVTLAVVCGWCLLAQRRVRARRKDPRVLMLDTIVTPASPLAVLALPAAVWTGAAVLIAGPLRELDPRLLVPCALLLGAIGLSQAGLGAALGYAFLVPSQDLLLAWALPITAGALFRLGHAQPMMWRSYTTMTRTIKRWGAVVTPPVVADRLWIAAGIGAVVSPLVALALTAGGPDLPLRTACAVMVAFQLGAAFSASSGRHRWIRRMGLAWLAGSVALVALLAGGPPGAWLAAQWPGGVAGGLFLSGVSVLAWSGRFGSAGLWRLPTFALRAMSGLGLVPYWTIVVFHPRPDALVTTGMLLGAETLLVLLRPIVGEDRLLATLDARFYAHTIFWPQNSRLWQLGCWLHDGFLRRTSRFDYAPVRIFLGMAVLGARGHIAPGQASSGFDRSSRRPLSGLDALRWTQAASQALDLIDAEVAPRLREDRLDELRRDQDHARADVALTRAIVLGHASQWPQALDEWRDAARRYRALGKQPSPACAGERLARTGAAWVLACRLSQLDAARRELARLPPNPPPDALARWAALVSGAAARDAGTAAKDLARARDLPRKPSLDWLHAEVVTGLTEIFATVEDDLAARSTVSFR
ncbi:hypothetical protein [Nonomuraea sp. NPDC049400]|uniref:hypothetical protein n=1 Tax=Nonomuraea sp. NPDC049400 TaxID=3364352 RepID=UPI00379DD249